jgi:hypothetical protein
MSVIPKSMPTLVNVQKLAVQISDLQAFSKFSCLVKYRRDKAYRKNMKSRSKAVPLPPCRRQDGEELYLPLMFDLGTR